MIEFQHIYIGAPIVSWLTQNNNRFEQGWKKKKERKSRKGSIRMFFYIFYV